MRRTRSYDHIVHAGNAGDVWKHFILSEAVDHLLGSERSLIYAESHVGRPEYPLDSCGEWTSGIGRCWGLLPSLINFCYFRVLSDLNSQGLWHYPGSASIVLEIARRNRLPMNAQVWDNDPEVARAWAAWLGRGIIDFGFHLGNGFAGVRSLLDLSPPGLLLIDPPYTDAEDVALAEDLIYLASEKGWTVLLWSMLGKDSALQGCNLERFSLRFSEMGMECGRWEGAIMVLHSGDRHLVERIRDQSAKLIKVFKEIL